MASILSAFWLYATGRFERTDQRNDETYVGIKGAFKAVIGGDDMQKPELRAGTLNTDKENSIASGICYMPDAWLQPILDTLKEAEANGAVVPTVRFVYGVYLGRRGEQDYEWSWKTFVRSGVDPLAGIVQRAGPSDWGQERSDVQEQGTSK